MNESRRAFLWTAGTLAASWLAAQPVRVAGAAGGFDVKSHGAIGNGRAKDTLAIQAAIDQAARSRGTVYFPPGEYVSGTLRLRSHVSLRLEAGATLIASPDDDDFDPVEKLGYESFADRETSDFRHALLQGRGISGVSILGPGRIDGNRASRRGPKPIALKECDAIRIRDLTVVNAGNYAISFVGCEDVEVRGVTILDGHADGIGPDCCRNVRISDCRIESADDAIVLKTSFALGARRSTENVTVTGCRLSTFHNALKLGTESTGDFRNIVFRDCTITGRRHPWKGDLSSGLSLESVDGGTLEKVTVSGLRMTDVRTPIFLRLARRGRAQPVPTPGALRDVSISDVVATGAMAASSITGITGHRISQIALTDIRTRALGGGTAEHAAWGVPQLPKTYPDAMMFHVLPAHGLYCRHVEGVRLEGIELTVAQPDARPAMVMEDVLRAEMRKVQASPAADGDVLMWLSAVRDGVLQRIRPSAGRRAVVRLSGSTTARIHLVREEHADDETLLVADPNVAPTAFWMGPVDGGAWPIVRRQTPLPPGSQRK